MNTIAELLALLLWREAQNQPRETIVAVGCSVRNRVERGGWWGESWTQVILWPFQYSSFMSSDPNYRKMPKQGDAVWAMCLAIAGDVVSGAQADTTDGATSYYDKSLDGDPPEWAAAMTHVMDSGAFHLYR